jgi:CBS domain-containing protein
MTEVKEPRTAHMLLRAANAAELMTADPVSVRDDATVGEAIAFLTDKGIGGAPVIDEAGRPVGVLTQSDILVHDRQKSDHMVPEEADSGDPVPHSWWDRFQLERVDQTLVRDLMTPAVFAVSPETPAASVVEQMRGLNVHRLFVVDADGVLVGVITALDVLRRLELPGS